MKKWLNFIQNCILPPTCIFCDNSGFSQKDICFYCFKQLCKNTNGCYRCGQHLEQSDNLCASCFKKAPDYDCTIAPFLYQGAMQHLIKGLKFNHHYKNAKLLGQLFSEALEKNRPLPDCIMPVPLHKNRYQERGFNQSTEIARNIAQYLKIPLELNTCIRHRDTPHQVSLPAKQRHENIKQAFSLSKTVCYSHIALFDDVMTTGSTVAEMTCVLKKAGVQKVEIWVCART